VKRTLTTLVAVGLLAAGTVPAAASTAVPGHQGKTSGTVVGHYTAHYWADSDGAYVWDLGDGRAYSTFSGWVADDSLDGWTNTVVDDVDVWLEEQRELLGDITEVCETTVNYRGDFGDDPYLDMGTIQNIDRCIIDGERAVSNSVIVHESDPRYEGNPDNAIWGTWEYHVLTESGSGNLVRPMKAVGSDG
jgi:hypothetical protein